MSAPSRIASIALLAAAVAWGAKERISILDFQVSSAARADVGPDASQDLTQQVRDVATSLMDPSRFEIMTRENILVMLPPGKSLSECEGQCEVETARNIGSRWHVVGDVKKVGRRLVLSVRLYDVVGGSQLSGFRVVGSGVDELVDSAGPRSRELLRKVPGVEAIPVAQPLPAPDTSERSAPKFLWQRVPDGLDPRQRAELVESSFDLLRKNWAGGNLPSDFPDRSSRQVELFRAGRLQNLGEAFRTFVGMDDAEIVAKEGIAPDRARMGLDMAIAMVGDSVRLLPSPGGSAARAGIRVGDRLLRIDGFSVDGASQQRIVEGLLGYEGAKVQVDVLRPGEASPRRFDVAHAVPSDGFGSALLGGGVGYVRPGAFQTGLAKRIAAALSDLRSRGASSLVLDLRGSAGGLQDEILGAASGVLPKGARIGESRGPGGTNPLVVGDLAKPFGGPCVVLVDPGTRSGSLFLAVAIREAGRGVLLGESSEGPGWPVKLLLPLPKVCRSGDPDRCPREPMFKVVAYRARSIGGDDCRSVRPNSVVADSRDFAAAQPTSQGAIASSVASDAQLQAAIRIAGDRDAYGALLPKASDPGEAKIPGLSEIPGIGRLFRHDR